MIQELCQGFGMVTKIGIDIVEGKHTVGICSVHGCVFIV